MEHRRAGNAPHEGPLKRKADISRVCVKASRPSAGDTFTETRTTLIVPHLVWPNLVSAKLGLAKFGLGQIWSVWPNLVLAKLGLAKLGLAPPFGPPPFGRGPTLRPHPSGPPLFLRLAPPWGPTKKRLAKNWIGQNWSNQDGQNGIGQSGSLPWVLGFRSSGWCLMKMVSRVCCPHSANNHGQTAWPRATASPPLSRPAPTPIGAHPPVMADGQTYFGNRLWPILVF